MDLLQRAKVGDLCVQRVGDEHVARLDVPVSTVACVAVFVSVCMSVKIVLESLNFTTLWSHTHKLTHTHTCSHTLTHADTR